MNIIDLLSDDDEDDALLMGSTQPIFTYSAQRPKTEPAPLSTPKSEPGVPKSEPGAAPKTEAGVTGVAAVTAPEQDSKPVVTMLGSCHFSIVGIQYAKTKVSVGESVKLQREPTNVSTVVAVLRLSATNVCLYRCHSLTFFRYSFATYCIGSPTTAMPFELIT
jgi:hypothetical protein